MRILYGAKYIFVWQKSGSIQSRTLGTASRLAVGDAYMYLSCYIANCKIVPKAQVNVDRKERIRSGHRL